MELYLTRQHSGLYMISEKKPVVSKIEGSEVEDVYFAPGEPFGIKDLPNKTLELFKLKKPLKKKSSVKIVLQGWSFKK